MFRCLGLMRVIQTNKCYGIIGGLKHLNNHFCFNCIIDDLIMDDFPEVQRSRDKLFIVKENILVLLLLVWIRKDPVTPRVN